MERKEDTDSVTAEEANRSTELSMRAVFSFFFFLIFFFNVYLFFGTERDRA